MSEYWKKEILVLGCGNILFGDDGFGPAVVDHINKKFNIPAQVAVINAGLSVREILFNILLSDIRPNRIIIVDAIDAGKKPGELFELDISDIPENKIDDFSMHQLPTSNLLRELQDKSGVEVKIISAQIENIPEEVAPGLSNVLREAVPGACQMILRAMTVAF